LFERFAKSLLQERLLIGLVLLVVIGWSVCRLPDIRFDLSIGPLLDSDGARKRVCAR